jgi:dipeptidyl aminopeptidase/acylaminoacyl peptidase
MLIAHGTQDRLVPFNQSELLYAAMQARGLDVTFERLENAGHGGTGFEADGPLFARCITFFRQHLV